MPNPNLTKNGNNINNKNDKSIKSSIKHTTIPISNHVQTKVNVPQILVGQLKQTNVITPVHQIQHPILHLPLHQIRIKKIKFLPHPTAFNHLLKTNLLKNYQMRLILKIVLKPTKSAMYSNPLLQSLLKT